VDISRKTMGGWMAQCANLLNPLYAVAKEVLFQSKVVGTDDTSVKVLDPKLPFARTGRIWPYSGDAAHPVILYDYTATRERAGPEEFLKGYRGHLQADAYGGYDAFFKDPARGLIEVGCWAHARRYFHKALESDQAHMGPALLLIAQLYRVEKQARPLSSEDRRRLRQMQSKPVLDKLRDYLWEIQAEVLPKSPAGRAVSYTLKNWTALNRYCEDGDLAIDNNATERAIRGVAVGRHNWTFFGSDEGGRTAAVLRSFVASCQRLGVDPFAWLKDVLSRIPGHSIHQLAELLPHNWTPVRS
jgi:transposase